MESQLVLSEADLAKSDVLYAPKTSSRRVLRIPGSHIAVKKGPNLDLVEGETLKFIRRRTTIPVPRVFNTYMQGGIGYILMEYVEGQKLADVWPKLAKEKRDIILSELREYIRQLRRLKHTEELEQEGQKENQNGRGNFIKTKIASVTGGPVVDRRVMGIVMGGPFASEQAFNAWQLDQLDTDIAARHRDMYAAMHKEDHEIVFSHGDLGFHNILVDDNHITAIIDWEDAGWFPEHWDYCKSSGYFSGNNDLYLAQKQIFEKQYFAEYLMDMWFTREVKHGGF